MVVYVESFLIIVVFFEKRFRLLENEEIYI